MKLTHLLPLAAVTSAFVLPSAETFREVETCHDETTPWYKTLFGDSERRLDDTKDALRRLVSQATEVSSDAWERIEETSEDAWEQVADSSRNAFDYALENAYEFAEDVEDEFVQTRDDVESWMEAQADGLQDAMDYAVLEAEDFMLETDEFMMDVDEEDHHGPPPPHHGPPPPHHGPPPPPHGDNGHHGDHGHHGGHGRHGHHGHHGDHDHDKHPKANETVLNLIKSSKYTTILAKVLDDHPKIAKLLNTTDFNGTVFAPTDKAFERIPKKFFEGLSKSQHEDLLKYHIVPGFYPAKRVLFTHTAPTLLESKQLSSKHPQRLRIGKSFKGLTVNFLSRIIAADIHATNGVIHGIDNLLFPPISAIHEIDLFPGEFSTLNLGLHKTGIWDKLNDTSHRGGGTFFAPNNWAFQKLGPRVNAFLFSSHGEKYLKALLKYHLVSKNTLYSDAFYPEKDSKDKEDAAGGRNIHVDLPTALKDRSLSIDITNWGPVVWMKVNGFTSVSVTDVVAADGVIQIMSSVLIPPKHAAMEEVEEIEEGEMTVEELIERLEPHVEEEEWKLDL